MSLDGDRIRYQTYNDVQSINAGRRDMWTVIFEAAMEADRRRGEAMNRQAQAPLPASVSATPEGSQRGRNDP